MSNSVGMGMAGLNILYEITVKEAILWWNLNQRNAA